MAASLASLALVKTFLPVREGTTSFDGKLKVLARMATMQIQVACARTFEKRAFGQYVNTRPTTGEFLDLLGTSDAGTYVGTSTMEVKLLSDKVDPATVDVRYDPRRLFGADSIVPSSNWELDAASNRLYVRHPMIEGTRLLKVNYDAGYEIGTEPDVEGDDWRVMQGVPDDLAMACALQTAFLWNKVAPNTLGLATDEDSKQRNSNAFNVRGGLVPDIIPLLVPYKRTLHTAR